MATLTLKRQRFVDEFLVDLNATKACERAGYAVKVANREGSRLLSNVDIQAAISARAGELHTQTELTQKRVLDELIAVGFSDIRDFMSWDDDGTTLHASVDLTDAQAACVEFIRVRRDVSHDKKTGDETKITEHFEFKLYNKLTALQKLGEHLKLFKPEQHTTQNFLHLHFGGEQEETEKPVEVEGLKLHLGE